MTLTSVGGLMVWPGIGTACSTTVSVGASTTLDALGDGGHTTTGRESHSIVLVAREAMVIDRVAFRPGTCTGTCAAMIRIETVDLATGYPSGTLYGTNTKIDTTGTLVTNTWSGPHVLDAAATIPMGSVFALKIAYVSGTSFVVSIINGSLQGSKSIPTLVTMVASAFTKSVSSAIHLIALGSSSTTFYNVHGLMPISAAGTAGFNNTGANKRALKFTIPFGCRVVGLRLPGTTATGDFNIEIREAGADTVINSSTISVDGNLGAGSVSGHIDYYFDNVVELTAAGSYRAIVEPTSSLTVNVYPLTIANANYRSTVPGGTAISYSTCTGGTWTDDTTQVPVIDLLIDQIDVGGSGSSGRNLIGV